ncbi:hypothetical protein F4556_001186 [Kitasatospora gansuensis]|uniref:Uncharacterized protein n=1 Tax=Kitasatospora gansuensis TaxID=258050 RepID=A0A7W7S833_9ACTN|nr:hypothetical protein [Kitasatospora gansuensis]MBB4945651.1 hypothetical protein [Kitasatospora gansuensis]
MIDFAFRPPSAWQLERAGRVTVTEVTRAGLAFPAGDWGWDFTPSPARLVVPVLERRPDRSTVSPEGRPAGVLELSGPDRTPLRVTVDDELGIVLRAHSPATGYLEEITGLRVHPALPDGLFTDPGDDGSDRAELRRYERIRAHCLGRTLPVPTAWPGALGRPAPIDGDPATGFLVLDLDVRPSVDLPTGAQLIRQPLTEPGYTGGWAADPGTYLHRWRDGRWQWTVAVTGRPLTPAQLAAVAAELAAGGS